MMQNAVWLASIFGPFLSIMGLWALMYSDNMMKICNSVKNSPAALYFNGVMNFLIGIFIVNQYNVWMMDIYFLITLLGWFAIVRGVAALFVPQIFMKCLMARSDSFKYIGLLPLVWGLALVWLAFFM